MGAGNFLGGLAQGAANGMKIGSALKESRMQDKFYEEMAALMKEYRGRNAETPAARMPEADVLAASPPQMQTVAPPGLQQAPMAAGAPSYAAPPQPAGLSSAPLPMVTRQPQRAPYDTDPLLRRTGLGG